VKKYAFLIVCALVFGAALVRAEDDAVVAATEEVAQGVQDKHEKIKDLQAMHEHKMKKSGKDKKDKIRHLNEKKAGKKKH